jgi:glycosyltransferase involved in cell wall biosynthesis
MALTVVNVAYPFAPVGPDAVGGAEQILTAVDAALMADGHRSIVIACRGSHCRGELIELPECPAAIDDAARQKMHRAARAAIRRVLSDRPVDVVHFHGIDFHEYLDTTVPALATLHLPLDWYPKWIFEPRGNLSLHCVSAAQHATRPPGAKLLPPIPNGVPAGLFETRVPKRDHAIVLCRVCPEKGVHLALRACREANLPLVIGGSVFPYEAHERYFREEIEPLLDEKRRYLGPLGFDRKRRLLASARCAIVPSLVAETSSLAAMEALACGTPVVAFRNGALPDIVKDGVTGFLVDRPDRIAAAIHAAGNIDPEVCRRTARRRFSEERMTRLYLERYRLLAH